jgi:hypothetical protein
VKIRHVKRFSKKQIPYAALVKLHTLPFTKHQCATHDDIIRDKAIINEIADGIDIRVVKAWNTGITKAYLRNIDDVAMLLLIAEQAIRVVYIFE